MEKKSLKIISIGLAVLLLLSIITIAILATLLVVKTQNNEINVEPAIIEKTDKVYSLANVNFATTADGNSTIGQSVNLQARVYPFNATNKELSWSLYWKNAESEWAINKIVSDYVTCVVDDENSTKARITELQAFGETIICKVSSVKQPDKFVIVEINHLATIIDFYAKFDYNGQTYEFTKNSTSIDTSVLNINIVKDEYIENFTLQPLYNDIYSNNGKSDLGCMITMLGGFSGKCTYKTNVSSLPAKLPYTNTFGASGIFNLFNRNEIDDIVFVSNNWKDDSRDITIENFQKDIPSKEFNLYDLLINKESTYSINNILKNTFYHQINIDESKYYHEFVPTKSDEIAFFVKFQNILGADRWSININFNY